MLFVSLIEPCIQTSIYLCVYLPLREIKKWQKDKRWANKAHYHFKCPNLSPSLLLRTSYQIQEKRFNFVLCSFLSLQCSNSGLPRFFLPTVFVLVYFSPRLSGQRDSRPDSLLLWLFKDLDRVDWLNLFSTSLHPLEFTFSHLSSIAHLLNLSRNSYHPPSFSAGVLVGRYILPFFFSSSSHPHHSPLVLHLEASLSSFIHT